MVGIENINIEDMYVGSDVVLKAYIGDTIIYDNDKPSERDYFQILANEDSIVTLTRKSSTHTTIEYNINNVWKPFTTKTIINLKSGEVLYVRGVLEGVQNGTDSTNFNISGNVKLKGNLNTLWNYENPEAKLFNSCGCSLFEGCTAIIYANELKLPSIELSTGCYMSMFHNCTNLITAPILLAPVLSPYCYNYMFQECNNLNYIECLATNISATNCTYQWTQNVASEGTFVRAEGMTKWVVGKNNGDYDGIPSGWTIENK